MRDATVLGKLSGRFVILILKGNFFVAEFFPRKEALDVSVVNITKVLSFVLEKLEFPTQ